MKKVYFCFLAILFLCMITDGFTLFGHGDYYSGTDESAIGIRSEITAADTDSKEKTVYVAESGNGKKYHNNENCSNMKGAVISMTVCDAEKIGYAPCKKCCP